MSDTGAERKAMVEAGEPEVDYLLEMVTGGPTWTTEELQRDFEVTGFAAPFVVVKRKSDGKRGTLEFTARPRVYFGFQED